MTDNTTTTPYHTEAERMRMRRPHRGAASLPARLSKAGWAERRQEKILSKKNPPRKRGKGSGERRKHARIEVAAMAEAGTATLPRPSPPLVQRHNTDPGFASAAHAENTRNENSEGNPSECDATPSVCSPRAGLPPPDEIPDTSDQPSVPRHQQPPASHQQPANSLETATISTQTLRDIVVIGQTSSHQSAATNKQPTTSSLDTKVTNEEPASSHETAAISTQTPPASSHQPSQQSAAESQQPTAINQQPITQPASRTWKEERWRVREENKRRNNDVETNKLKRQLYSLHTLTQHQRKKIAQLSRSVRALKYDLKHKWWCSNRRIREIQRGAATARDAAKRKQRNILTKFIAPTNLVYNNYFNYRVYRCFEKWKRARQYRLINGRDGSRDHEYFRLLETEHLKDRLYDLAVPEYNLTGEEEDEYISEVRWELAKWEGFDGSRYYRRPRHMMEKRYNQLRWRLPGECFDEEDCYNDELSLDWNYTEAQLGTPQSGCCPGDESEDNPDPNEEFHPDYHITQMRMLAIASFSEFATTISDDSVLETCYEEFPENLPRYDETPDGL